MLSSPPWQTSTCLASKDVMTACRENNWLYYRSAPTSVALECLLELPVETREIFIFLVTWKKHWRSFTIDVYMPSFCTLCTLHMDIQTRLKYSGTTVNWVLKYFIGPADNIN